MLIDLSPRCTMRSPLMATELCCGSIACRAFFENVPANCIIFTITPPVILVVCWYEKSASKAEAASVMAPAIDSNFLSMRTASSYLRYHISVGRRGGGKSLTQTRRGAEENAE